MLMTGEVAPTTQPDIVARTDVEALLKRMTLAEKIGQMTPSRKRR